MENHGLAGECCHYAPRKWLQETTKNSSHAAEALSLGTVPGLGTQVHTEGARLRVGRAPCTQGVNHLPADADFCADHDDLAASPQTRASGPCPMRATIALSVALGFIAASALDLSTR